jgi:hypothetical protein
VTSKKINKNKTSKNISIVEEEGSETTAERNTP